MAKLVETVARAIHDLGEPGIVDCRDLARAAIAAQLNDMAEPSLEVIDAGFDASETSDCSPSAVWQAMLAQYRKGRRYT